MQPHSGELTRMGGYLENNFGWNRPQEKFTTPLFKRAESLDEYDQYYGVVVFGDSFSEDLDRGWQYHLVAETGWSVISFNMNNIALDELLEMDVYKDSPPKLFICESIERNVIRRHSQCVYGSHRERNNVVGVGRSLSQLSDPSSVLNYWRKTVARLVFGRNTAEVHNFKRSTTGLLSNHEDSQLLVNTRDFNLKGVTSEQSG